MKKFLIVILLLIAFAPIAAFASINSDMRTSERGIELIKRFEGVRLRAYRCPAGVLTIGYGHTGGVREGQIITAEEARVYLAKDLIRFERHIATGITKRRLKQGEFDANASLCYNAGYRIRGNLARNINENDTEGVAREFRKIVHAGGKTLPGLVRRREAEIILYKES